MMDQPNIRFKYAWQSPARYSSTEIGRPSSYGLEVVDYTTPWDMSDIIFKVEGKNIYASKTILAMWSPVMKAMFVDDFKEKTAKEIELPGKHHEDILELVKVLHPPNQDLHAGNVGLILPLAQEYQMEDLTQRCERYLLDRPPSVQNLVLAEEYALNSLQNQCMEYVRGTKLRDLYEEPEFDILSKDTKVTILQDKSTRYENLLGDVKDVIKGEKPEQVRFRVGGTLCTFTCTDKEYLKGNKDSRNNKDESKEYRSFKEEKRHKENKRDKESYGKEKSKYNKELAHNAGTEMRCKACALYMINKIDGLCKELP